MANINERPSLTYQVKHNRIIGKVDHQQAMVQAVDKILRTSRFVFPIYDDQYGNDFEQLFGKSMTYARVEVERMLKEALLADDRVLKVQVDELKQVNATTLAVHGWCETIFGNVPITSEVIVNESGRTGPAN